MKTLVITDKYFPKAHANSICIQNVIEKLQEMGHECDVLAYRDTGIKSIKEYHGISVKYIKPDFRTRLFYYTENKPNAKFVKLADFLAISLNRLKKMIMLPFFPLYSISCPKRIFKKAMEMHRANNYDMVISVYCPFDAVLGAYWFKKKNEKVKWCIYSVDTFINYRYSFLKNRGNNNRWLFKFLDLADGFIYMKSRENEYNNERFTKWRNKMYVSDIPCMIENLADGMSNQINNNSDDWIYAGALYSPHYNSDDLIKIFLNLPSDRRRVLHFYSSGRELEELKHYEIETEGKIQCHEFVPHDELLKIYQSANVLVSMKYTAQISAKIFEYMSYKKPVLHISGTIEDPNAIYINQYSKGLVINAFDGSSLKHKVNKVVEWIENINEVDSSLDEDFFIMNYPEYTATMLLKMVEK